MTFPSNFKMGRSPEGAVNTILTLWGVLDAPDQIERPLSAALGARQRLSGVLASPRMTEMIQEMPSPEDRIEFLTTLNDGIDAHYAEAVRMKESDLNQSAN